MWEQLKRVIKPGGAIVLFGSQPFSSALVMSNPRWFRYEWIWEKDKPVGFLNAGRRPLSAHETILVFADGQTPYYPQFTTGHKPYNAGSRLVLKPNQTYGAFNLRPGKGDDTRFPRSVLRFNGVNGAEKQEHPTQKPVDLMKYLISSYTYKGEIVLDFTMVSGTTGVACVETGRNFIGIEREPDYFAVAQTRIEAAAASLRQLEMAV